MINPLLHIGYPKTGSSWLQSFLFGNSDAGFAFLFGNNLTMRKAIIKLLVLPKPLVFDLEVCSEHFQPMRLDLINKGLIPVLSHERLAGTPHSGGYDSKELASRLAGIFPEGKVLIIIRNQKSMIVSAYKQYVRNGGVCSLRRYLQPPYLDGRIPLFDFDYFEYHRLIRHYLNLFGSSNVLVLPYELFREEPKEFVLKIIQFSGARAEIIEGLPYSSQENAALSGLSTAIKRRLNRIVARRDSTNPQVLLSIPRRLELLLEQSLQRFDSVIPRSFQRVFDKRLKVIVSEMVGDKYKESNCLTAEMLNLDLGMYGYDLP